MSSQLGPAERERESGRRFDNREAPRAMSVTNTFQMAPKSVFGTS